jgi:hypothetical protein
MITLVKLHNISGVLHENELHKVHLLYKPGYVIPWVSSLTEDNSDLSMFEFATGK